MTQPLHTNYGGLLQAYALQKSIRDLGHEVKTVDIPFKKNRKKYFRNVCANIVKKYVLNRNIERIRPVSDAEKEKYAVNTERFITENITLTEKVPNVSKIDVLNQYNFDCFVVGSDQVWRPIYSPGIESYFLNFLGENRNIRRVSYAASFGVDNVDEFTKLQLDICSEYAKKFDAISVRENSALDILRVDFGVEEPKLVTDPTLLLKKEDYEELVNKDAQVKPSSGNLMVYVLDKSPDKEKVVESVSLLTNYKTFTVLPNSVTGVYPPVTQWVKGFMDAEFVVTDSFHGVVFSLLFNRQFIAIGNKGRGLARFTSILGQLGLLNRLILSDDQSVEELLNNPIDYVDVNKKLDEFVDYSKLFLKNSLS